ALSHSASGGEDEGEGVIRGGAVENAGGVGDCHTGGLGGIQVDIVVADSHIGDDLQLVSGSCKQRGIHPFGQRDDGGACAGDALFQFGTARRVFVADPHF